jgi:hypothetical protein
MKYALSFCFFILNSCFIYGQNLAGLDLVKCQPKISFEKRKYLTGLKKIKRKEKDRVSIYFFQNFSDTVMVSVNNVEKMRKYIIHDSELVSTNFTGEYFAYKYELERNTVGITYKNRKMYLEFFLDKKYPLYMVYVDGDKCWVSGRIYPFAIK